LRRNDSKGTSGAAARIVGLHPSSFDPFRVRSALAGVGAILRQKIVGLDCDLQKLDERGVRGAPDWVAEVLSTGTARHDQFVKVPAYERAGVREMWLVNPIDCTLILYRLEGGRYRRAIRLELKGQTQITAVPGVTIDWDEVLSETS
jgi:Putative restriction endonuclease